MSRIEIMEQISGVIRTVFDDETLEITERTTAADVEDWDSLEQINILVALERLFGVKFSVAEVGHLADVGAIADLVERKLEA